VGSPISRSARVLILLVGGAIALAAWVGWRVARDPAFPFLTHDAAAEWILFPAPPSTLAHPGEEVETAFRASFDLASVPARATLRARCFHAGDATLNDTPVDVPCAGETDWKRTVEGDVARALRPGANVLSVRVRSRFGPPALWLSIEGTGIGAASAILIPVPGTKEEPSIRTAKASEVTKGNEVRLISTPASHFAVGS